MKNNYIISYTLLLKTEFLVELRLPKQDGLPYKVGHTILAKTMETED